MKEKENKARVFEGKKIRTHWNGEKEKWFFSIVDVIEVLTGSSRPRKYWADLKSKLKEEGSELSENIGQLKMVAEDGKLRETDVADTEQILRLIQSIPSKKAEPLKLWLARVGNERIDETHNPELAIDRAMKTYLKKGYSKEWINQRLKTIEVRKELTDEYFSENLYISKSVKKSTITLSRLKELYKKYWKMDYFSEKGDRSKNNLESLKKQGEKIWAWLPYQVYLKENS